MKDNDTRRMEITFNNNNININKLPKEDNNIREYWKLNNDMLINNELGQGLTNEIIQKPQSVVFNSHRHKNSSSGCDEDMKDTCHKIKLLNTFTCDKDNNVLHISKICDGKADCSDFSDEVNCARRAVECVQNVGRVMSYIDSSLPYDCYETLTDKSIFSKHNKVLRSVLQNQLNFIQKHTVVGPETYSRRVFNADTPSLINTVTEVTNVVSTLTAALEAAVCNKNISRTRKQVIEIRKDKIFDLSLSTTWSPRVCECNGMFCKKTCSPECVDVCWQKYSLNRWQCQAVNGERSVTLDLICDGKLDCYDETDENGCSEERSIAKYEAMEMYNYILQLIMSKSSMKQYEMFRNNLLTLHDLIIKLQKLSLKLYADVAAVKRVRENCFSEIISIYNNALRFVSTPEEIIEIYIFLLSLNEKLVSALKRSHTGNDKIISSDGCVCRNYKCALSVCSKSCRQACKAQAQLTRYYCSGSSSINNSVSIEAICNGKESCPMGDDEANCSEELCLKHHLVLLRVSLRDAGERYKGTSFGEALIQWRTKATAMLMISESEGRPTPAVIQDLVQEILQDLVMSYASIKDFRRSNKIFEEYLKWSRVVINAVRSCGH